MATSYEPALLEKIMLYTALPPDPFNDQRGMIIISDPAKRAIIQRSSSSSFGVLDSLPLEILHHVLELLDFQSLSRLSRVSIAGKSIVESVLAYQIFMDYAPHVLTALSRTHLIASHSAKALFRAIISGDCIACGEYGAYLFLPTAERCCLLCLHKNQGLWVIPTATAKDCFNLTSRQLKSIPNMLSIPGRYFVGRNIARKLRLKLVSVKAAKLLAIKVHGSIKTMFEIFRAREYERDGRVYLYQWLLKAPLEPISPTELEEPSWGIHPGDKYCGMASIVFPSLSPTNTTMQAIWCRGCEWLSRQSGSETPENDLSRIIPPGAYPLSVLQALKFRDWSTAEFLEHIKTCEGVQVVASELIQELADRGWR
jgi:hypothetical protein